MLLSLGHQKWASERWGDMVVWKEKEKALALSQTACGPRTVHGTFLSGAQLQGFGSSYHHGLLLATPYPHIMPTGCSLPY